MLALLKRGGAALDLVQALQIELGAPLLWSEEVWKGWRVVPTYLGYLWKAVGSRASWDGTGAQTLCFPPVGCGTGCRDTV